MASPLWTDRYAPALEELPQPHLRRYLRRVRGRPVNLLLYGPPGAGKTAAIRALVRETHDDPEAALLEINVSDFFDRTKREIAEDERFAGFIEDTRWSKRRMIQHVFRESTAHAPVDGEFRTVLLDNAESVREDFQHALRRLIERHHRTTQFVLTSRHLGKVIPALQSRCLPVPVPAPDDAFVVDRVAAILDAEAVGYDDHALDLVAAEADGNLRRAILTAQASHVNALRDGDGTVTEAMVYDTVSHLGYGDAIDALLSHAEAGAFADARDVLDDLLIEEGLDGGEILDEILSTGRTRYDQPGASALACKVAACDFGLATGGDDRIQLSKLLAEMHDFG